MFFGLLEIKSFVSDHVLFFSITEETRLFSDFDLFLTLNGLVPLQLVTIDLERSVGELHFHPRVFHHLLKVDSIVRLRDENFLYKVLRLLADVLPRLRSKVVLAVFDLLKQLEVVLFVERHCAGEHDEGDNAYAPIIARGTVLFGSEHLRRYIARCAASRTGQLLLEVFDRAHIELARQAKISDFQIR